MLPSHHAAPTSDSSLPTFKPTYENALPEKTRNTVYSQAVCVLQSEAKDVVPFDDERRPVPLEHWRTMVRNRKAPGNQASFHLGLRDQCNTTANANPVLSPELDTSEPLSPCQARETESTRATRAHRRLVKVTLSLSTEKRPIVNVITYLVYRR